MTKMTEAYAIEISGWRYGGEYQIYDTPAWDEMVADGWALADAEKRKGFCAFVAEGAGLPAGDQLVAFTRHTFDDGGIMLGVGVNPACLSRGYGTEAIRQTVAYLAEKHPGVKIFLDVRTWNTRAVRSYEKAGFAIGETVVQETHAGTGEFYRMYYNK